MRNSTNRNQEMKRYLIIGISIFIIGILAVAFIIPQISTIKNRIDNNDPKALFQIYKEKLSALRLPDIDLKNITFDSFMVIFPSNYPIWAKRYALLTLKDNMFYMTVDLNTDKVTSCSNKYVGKNPENVVTLNLKPEKTKDEIIYEAKKYLTILNGEVPKDATITYVKYEIPSKYDNENSKECFWAVRWLRKKDDLIVDDGKHFIEIGFNEKHGLKYYFNNF